MRLLSLSNEAEVLSAYTLKLIEKSKSCGSTQMQSNGISPRKPSTYISDLLIVQLLFEGSDYLKVVTILGWRLFEECIAVVLTSQAVHRMQRAVEILVVSWFELNSYV